jgi:hypothetical protein
MQKEDLRLAKSVNYLYLYTLQGVQVWFYLHSRGTFMHYLSIFVGEGALWTCRGKLVPSSTFHSRFVLTLMLTWRYWKAAAEEPFVDKVNLVK